MFLWRQMWWEIPTSALLGINQQLYNAGYSAGMNNIQVKELTDVFPNKALFLYQCCIVLLFTLTYMFAHDLCLLQVMSQPINIYVIYEAIVMRFPGRTDYCRSNEFLCVSVSLIMPERGFPCSTHAIVTKLADLFLLKIRYGIVQ